jgi:hypothetical protein
MKETFLGITIGARSCDSHIVQVDIVIRVIKHLNLYVPCISDGLGMCSM